MSTERIRTKIEYVDSDTSDTRPFALTDLSCWAAFVSKETSHMEPGVRLTDKMIQHRSHFLAFSSFFSCCSYDEMFIALLDCHVQSVIWWLLPRGYGLMCLGDEAQYFVV